MNRLLAVAIVLCTSMNVAWGHPGHGAADYGIVHWLVGSGHAVVGLIAQAIAVGIVLASIGCWLRSRRRNRKEGRSVGVESIRS